MAIQVGSVCYDSAASAASAVASAESGKIVPAGSVVYVVSAEADSAGQITYTLTDTAGVQPAVTYTQTPWLPECGLLTAADANVMGWGVAAAWLMTYAVLMVRKGW